VIDLTGEPMRVTMTILDWQLLVGLMDNVHAVENVGGDRGVAEAAMVVRQVGSQQVAPHLPQGGDWPPEDTVFDVAAPAGLWRFVTDVVRDRRVFVGDGSEGDRLRTLAGTIRSALPSVQVREVPVDVGRARAGRRNEDVRVCFVGDSFVAGVGDSAGFGWVGRVVAASAERARPLTAYNLGVRRQTSVQIAARAAVEVPPRLAEAGEARVVLSFGVNDTKMEDGAQRVSTEDTLAALHDAVRAVAPVPVLVVGPPSVVDEAHDERARRLAEALRVECATAQIPFLDAHGATSGHSLWLTQARAGDGAHPGAAGYAQLAAALTNQVLEWIDDPLD
jgi:acyl-CoA thioesterase-1